MRGKTKEEILDGKRTYTTADQVAKQLNPENVITEKVVGIMNDGEVFFDAPESFLKMIDEMREIVTEQLPTWNTKMLVFIINKTGWHIMVHNEALPPPDNKDVF